VVAYLCNLQQLRQEDNKFQAHLKHIARLCLQTQRGREGEGKERERERERE
jgi:hypothetical protein